MASLPVKSTLHGKVDGQAPLGSRRLDLDPAAEV
jgi:hypothetical protein